MSLPHARPAALCALLGLVPGKLCAGLLWKAHVDTQLRKKMRAYDWDTTTLAPAQAPAPSKPGNSWRCYAPQAGMGIMQNHPKGSTFCLEK